MSGDASASSSGNLADNFFTSPPPPKKKRNLPGNPDPDAEVLALSPKTLMATNRFVCEICNKGFQRDQNLQLHRRGHNLPWKLKQRNNKEAVRKKVYVCPEETCVHHHPSRALGDLTGIKKHFSRKHGEKKFKCDKCSKRYAVQSDWKAHSKTCGTREYRCDCGTLFSRRDSFITHRAFCDALAEESARTNPILIPSPHQQIPNPLSPSSSHINPFSSLKNEPNSYLRPDLPPWLSSLTPNQEDYAQTSDYDTQNRSFLQYHHFPPSSSPSVHMSATALLQKAAQIGAASPATGPSSMAGLHHHTPQPEVGAAVTTDGGGAPSSAALLMEVMSSLSSAGGFGGASFGDLLESGNDGMTRDFLGLRALSHSEILNIAGLGNCINTAPLPPPDEDHRDQNQKPWQS